MSAVDDVREQVESERACSHPAQEVRYSVASNGMRQYRLQCLTCGELSQFLKKADPRVMLVHEIQPVDDVLRERYWTETHAEVQRRRLIAQDQERLAWWAQYNDYLQSGAWEQRRRLVLERDGYLCQSCRVARATQAHHLTYAHLYDEPCFDLVGVCGDCHARLTAMDRARRGEAAA